jgi:hemerythrin-like domain-containing protein
MARPILNSFNRIHKAIKGELLKLEQQARAISADDAQSVSAFTATFGFVENIQAAHSHEEEETVWPEVEARNPGMMATFRADHEAEHVFMDDIKANLSRLQGAGDGNTDDATAGIYRNTVALVSHLHHHMTKEEAIPYTTLADQMDDKDEFVLIGRILDGLPEELVVAVMPWWASYQTPEDIVDEHKTTLAALGPEKAAVFGNTIINSLPPDKWEAVRSIDPDLAQFRRA